MQNTLKMNQMNPEPMIDKLIDGFNAAQEHKYKPATIVMTEDTRARLSKCAMRLEFMHYFTVRNKQLKAFMGLPIVCSKKDWTPKEGGPVFEDGKVCFMSKLGALTLVKDLT